MDPLLNSAWEDWLAATRADLEGRRLWRRLRVLCATDGLHGTIGGREVVLFSSNDYLGLASHPAVRAATAEASSRAGMGPRAAPLVCGYTEEHAALEEDLAALTVAGSALLFATGYAANLSVLTALADEGTAIFSDELNHASIVDGCRLARARGAEVKVYRHADAGHLDDLLRACAAPRRLVVTDSVFSMDGDLAPLPDLVELRRRHGALLAVDEAHALLVLGARGGGLAEALGLAAEVDVRVGTLGKALGSQGGFTACSPALREHLVNRGRPFVYSTAPTLPAVAAVRAAPRVFREEPGWRETLDRHRATLSAALGSPLPSAIGRFVLGEEERALAAAEALLSRGFLVPAIRPPTVPPGTSRLRITLSAGHTDEEVDALCAALGRGIPPPPAPPG